MRSRSMNTRATRGVGSRHTLHRAHPPRVISALAMGLAMAPSAEAQWDQLDLGAPHVVEMVGATNLIVDRWAIAARHFEAVLENEPEHPTAAWLATHCLVEEGEYARALSVGERALAAPRTRGVVALELARAAAAAGDLERALEFLGEAREAQLVMPAKLLRRDECLASLRKEPAFIELSRQVDDVPGRMERLADEGDVPGLVMLCHGASAMAWSDIPTFTWVLKEWVDEHSQALDRGREKDASRMAARLERAARAADEALGVELHMPWIERAVDWDGEERKRNKRLWKDYKGVGSGIRGHRFARVLETLGELEREARELGDFMALYSIHRTQGMVHSGVLNYRQAREGIGREEEYRLGRAAFLQRLEWARQIEDIAAVVDAYDFLATFETQVPKLSLAEAEQLIFGGIMAMARVQPEDRELGMFEGMWRDLQEIDR